jgi:hypothetical protein
VKATVSLRTALDDSALLGDVLAGESWLPWRAILLASMGEELTPSELNLFTELTGRTVAPPQRVDELWAIVGRRGGKSKAMAALTVYIAGLCDHRDVLTAGERGVALCISPDREQSKITLNYVNGILESRPMLSQLIANRTADTLELTNGIVVEVRGANFRRLRGPTCVAVIADEAAFWLSEETANPDTEILNAVRPSLMTTHGPLIVISSPYARKGEVWETYRRDYGANGNPLILVAQGASRIFNSTIPQYEVDKAFARDHARASAEYGALFRTDIESLITIEAVRACIEAGVRERGPDRSRSYVGFVDPSGGSSDSFTMAIAHKQGQRHGPETLILDAVREVKPPFSPEQVVVEFSELLKKYRISKIAGDHYAGQWPREQFRKNGISYELSDRTKSELFLDLLPYINSRMVDLLDHDKMVSQLVSLERRTSQGGKDSITHHERGHDDVINAVAGALCRAAAKTSVDRRDEHRSERSFPKVNVGFQSIKERSRLGSWS